MPFGWAAGAAAITGIAGSVLSSNAAGDAAQTQANAANTATQASQAQNATTRADLAPYNAAGQNALTSLSSFANGGSLPSTYQPFSMTQSQLEQTPGYQFDLSQGLKSTQNAAAARGLGSSGAALKGAATFATGLADNTYTTQLNNYMGQQAQGYNQGLSNYNSRYNALSGVATLGENAAAKTGSIGADLTGQANNALLSGANASAAGTIGSANAISGGLTGAANSYTNGLLYSKLFSQPNTLTGPGAGSGGLY